MERQPAKNRFEFVTLASARARQLLNGCIPREEGDHKKTVLARREVLSRKVEKVKEE